MRPGYLLIAALGGLISTCSDQGPDQSQDMQPEPTYIGGVHTESSRLESLVDPAARPEILATGYSWSEGPLWISEGELLVFSDVPENVVHAWSESGGAREWLRPSGNTGPTSGEGSNGLLLDADGHLVLCQHGDRRMARMTEPLWDPSPTFETIVGTYEGHRFNSPNDAVYGSDGSLWFTDPPYGLQGQDQSPDRELDFNGVFVLRPDGDLQVVTDSLTRPNGIALSPDERTLYVANSDSERAYWVAIDLTEDGEIGEGRVLFDATPYTGSMPGLPDGLKVDVSGNLFASGPGGVWVLDASGAVLGRIETENATANVAFGGSDGSTLFMTSSSNLLRIPLRTRGRIASVSKVTS